MTVRNYFASPGDITLEMVLAMVFPLRHSEEIKTFVAVLQLGIFTAGGLAVPLKPAVLNVISPVRAFKTNEGHIKNLNLVVCDVQRSYLPIQVTTPHRAPSINGLLPRPVENIIVFDTID